MHFLAPVSAFLVLLPAPTHHRLSVLPMLTVEKLMLLIQCNWDEDLFIRSASTQQKALLADLDWSKYASLLQDLTLISKKLVSPEYARTIHRQLLAACADEATAQTFIGYASTL